MHGSPELARFAEAVGRDALPPDHAAPPTGAWDYRERDLAVYRAELDSLAGSARPEGARAGGGVAGARAISGCLFGRLGVCGNHGDYCGPRNRFLCDVLDRRSGIPISRSVLYLEV